MNKKDVAERLTGVEMNEHYRNENKFTEPCDCDGRPMHDDGGNYHAVVIFLDRDEGQYALITDTRDRFGGDSSVLVTDGDSLTVRFDRQRVRDGESVVQKLNDGDRIEATDG